MLHTLLALGDALLSGAMFTVWDKSQRNMMFSVQKSRSRNFIVCEHPGDMTRNGSLSPDGVSLKLGMQHVLSPCFTSLCRQQNMKPVRLLIRTVVQSQEPIIQ